jgi:hypothetical protein
VGSTVVRATVSPTAALLLPLVASLLDVCLVLHCRAGMMVVLDKITMAAACWSWGLGIMNISDISIVVYLAQPSSLDVLELVGKVGCAGWRGLQRHPAAQGRVACVDSGVGRLVRHVENGLLEIFLAVCGSSAPAPSCWVERSRQTSWAAAAVLLGRVARARLLLVAW